ncbi:DUF3667 domain-containing protein [Flavobacterium wongokense]|uniref:DUF3667 domain-containing protein n=1 Tax=Flavobacterium wongokense TaxID=2910674 RepID=UPI001F15BF89|nr:DUF3667 domain-containing protein [Flavobacterium sp. WG47]MCF6132505.1 DUF3667 domain-containing protein [Flavobacterium sp. WG47]
MTNPNCLNCGDQLTNKFCSGCGQKADTHRITFKNFIFHDVVHGTFHLDKGILFTAKQALVRPGKAALEYIAGKRKRYYNVFYLILMAIGVMLFIRHIDELLYPEEVLPPKVYLNEASRKMDELFIQKSKFILFLYVPFAALNTFILFRRKKLNLSEHSIISGMILLGILLLGTFANLYFPINNFLNWSGMAASMVVTVIINAYVIYGYINAFGSDYSKWGIAYRMVLFYALICLEIYILFVIAFGFVSNWKFGPVNIAPFG